jgi:beta-galactosidase
MIRQTLNEGWTVAPRRGLFAELTAVGAPENVTLPHDALRDLPRDPRSPNGSHSGYHPSAHVFYERVIEAHEDWAHKNVIIEFEGVYRDAVVFLNGDFVGQRPAGYSPFILDLGPFLKIGERNILRVEARTHQDSRWYTGVGIYRNVWLAVSDRVHIPLDGVVVTTPQVDDDLAVVALAVTVRNDSHHTRTLRLASVVVNASDESVSETSVPVTVLPSETAIVRVRHYVRSPRRWDLDDPYLYLARSTLLDETGASLDTSETTLGIRTIQVDPVHGFRLNGRSVKMRGGCIHHDNGAIGAAAIDRAEHRKAELLKAAGFNAVRSAHNGISRTLLDACDRIGLLVMDELTDVWTTGKSSYDTSLTFPDWWERDLEALVRNDRNHPSVVMYSIGNEILEIGRPGASAWGRRLAEKVRELDPTRPVTNAVNGLMAVLDVALKANESMPFDFNAILGDDGSGAVGASEAVTTLTEEAHAQVDVAGINYSEMRYDLDAELFPERIVVGTETFPGRLDSLWALVEKHPQVIGDFAWTAWDHLGEAGVGRAVYEDDPVQPAGMASPHPWLLSQAGTIDINGIRRPISYWREAVWGLTTDPYIAVHRPQGFGRKLAVGRWAWDDVLNSWAWDASDGSPVVVDVYADADEIELLLDADSLGVALVGVEVPGRTRACIARFHTVYRRGTLTAVARRGGREIGRTKLQSLQGQASLHACVERDQVSASPRDLAYVHITLADADGTVAVDAAADVTVTVTGPGELVALSNAKPDDETPFSSNLRRTHEGRLLAIVRPTGVGQIAVAALSGSGEVQVHINAE